jgi:hypothetical protein
MACSKVYFKSPDEILEQNELQDKSKSKITKWEPCIKPSEGIPCGPDGKDKEGTIVEVDSQKGNFECGCQNVAVDTKTLPKPSWKPSPPSNPDPTGFKDPKYGEQ